MTRNVDINNDLLYFSAAEVSGLAKSFTSYCIVYEAMNAVQSDHKLASEDGYSDYHFGPRCLVIEVRNDSEVKDST